MMIFGIFALMTLGALASASLHPAPLLLLLSRL